MFVCVCNAIREHDLRTAAQKGIMCAKKAYAEMGSKPKCGLCLTQARKIIAEEGVIISNQSNESIAA